MRIADAGIAELQKHVDTLIVIPNQNLFRVANEKTTFADAFAMADQVLYSGVACITDLMVKEGLINLDFADVRSVMREMGKAMMGTGEASGEGRALAAAEAAISNPLLDETSMKGARGLLISISGGSDLTLYEIDEAANRIRQEVDEDANVIFGATRDEGLEGVIRVSVVATGIDRMEESQADHAASERRLAEVADRIAQEARARHNSEARSAPIRRAPLAIEPQPAPVIALAPAPIAPTTAKTPSHLEAACICAPTSEDGAREGRCGQCGARRDIAADVWPSQRSSTSSGVEVSRDSFGSAGANPAVVIAAAFEAASRKRGVSVTRIGEAIPGHGLQLRDAAGRGLALKHSGYDHF